MNGYWFDYKNRLTQERVPINIYLVLEGTDVYVRNTSSVGN